MPETKKQRQKPEKKKDRFPEGLTFLKPADSRAGHAFTSRKFYK